MQNSQSGPDRVPHRVTWEIWLTFSNQHSDMRNYSLHRATGETASPHKPSFPGRQYVGNKVPVLAPSRAGEERIRTCATSYSLTMLFGCDRPATRRSKPSPRLVQGGKSIGRMVSSPHAPPRTPSTEGQTGKADGGDGERQMIIIMMGHSLNAKRQPAVVGSVWSRVMRQKGGNPMAFWKRRCLFLSLRLQSREGLID